MFWIVVSSSFWDKFVFSEYTYLQYLQFITHLEFHNQIASENIFWKTWFV